jgi:hypothetical protein
MLPEVKIEALALDIRGPIDPAKPVTGKLILRGLRRMPETQYFLVISLPGPSILVPLDKAPGPDADTFNFSFGPIPGGAVDPNPRLAIFTIGRPGRPGDLFGDQANHIISDPIPLLLDIAK